MKIDTGTVVRDRGDGIPIDPGTYAHGGTGRSRS